MDPEGILHKAFVSKQPVLSLMPEDRATLENPFFYGSFFIWSIVMMFDNTCIPAF